jgi:hypothetical protein
MNPISRVPTLQERATRVETAAISGVGRRSSRLGRGTELKTIPCVIVTTLGRQIEVGSPILHLFGKENMTIFIE